MTLNPEYASKPPSWMTTLFASPDPTQHRWDQPLWQAFEQLGMTERYESLIASVCYEHIEEHIVNTYSKVWDKLCLEEAREWMSRHVVPWLLMPYAPNAKTGRYYTISLHLFILKIGFQVEEARPLLAGMGTRLDYHVCKTIADLRCVRPHLTRYDMAHTSVQYERDI
jgi:anaphase-promoting complex subunit 2